MKRCKLTYWTGDKGGDGEFVTIEALLNIKDINRLMSDTPPKFIEAIINDGEWMAIPVENINKMVQVY
ncbi:hypothetical protein FC84_GL001659 [Lapidilactobacillus dextrinicus DSM 20335]|uniref:Uncharacterized protein n=1 Tax=Lapidilactobacillus dextrinicus DSM 20335 TaxID=1423738 RepID=A0A0R2BJJ2_9LACO|nr:hypothetical protein [Lapidilactobacillus dextrinicus]KRM79479.1 hypothetical protein FC84_GL001659 [Lapidilactobacillus dextrinicus DSM 20335]QFG46685.1 hypothetical protein LH506_04160 [Lapidilactobacillus dextrinicus]